MKNVTTSTSAKQIVRTWHLFDVKGQVLGRVATTIAQTLIGKNKPYFVRNLDCGNFVVVINSKDVITTGKKEKSKLYTQYSGYPGGIKKKALWQVRNEKPNELIRHAVMGMLPNNKLRDRLITRLYIYSDDKHPYASKLTK